MVNYWMALEPMPGLAVRNHFLDLGLKENPAISSTLLLGLDHYPELHVMGALEFSFEMCLLWFMGILSKTSLSFKLDRKPLSPEHPGEQAAFRVWRGVIQD